MEVENKNLEQILRHIAFQSTSSLLNCGYPGLLKFFRKFISSYLQSINMWLSKSFEGYDKH